MLQLPAYREVTERKSLLSNQEIKKFITSQQQRKQEENNLLRYERILEISK